ncbi:MAG: hypothetical protein EXR94_10535 [Gemmatimonadetes bacterium]|nr:hypothetical protein [Gemmatimonadota bacterium]
MRRLALLLPLVIGCAKAEVPKDEAATVAPAATTEADIAGTWSGELHSLSDSLLGQFTQACGGGTCRATVVGQPDTVLSTYVLSADSAVGSVGARSNPSFPGIKVTEQWVSRITGPGTVMGTGRFMLAENPDSVLLRYRFTGTKAP